MSKFMLVYIARQSPVHRLSGVVKFIIFILWSSLGTISFDTRVMAVQCVLGLFLFRLSRIKFAEYAFIFKMLILLLVLNLIAIYLFAPEQGTIIYGTRTEIARGIGRFTITAEQLFYELNILLKYILIIPIAIMLILTTSPSEFAASLNRIGISYFVAYSVSLALRYIPDIQRDYENISRSQQARGVELSRKASVLKRLAGASRILLPLIFSSIDRIDVITHAMELRGFGKNKKRTWYTSRPVTKTDYLILIAAVLLFIAGICITFRGGSRFYNPFIAG
jgi:energy-coupling factor transport system permease protein